ncbi:MAG: hypothetical protein L0229_25835 [Blastocatellia bacterium]|nr:hypothetical protein [Blastocatellia bacterium]
MVTNRVGPPVRGEDFYGRDEFVKLVSNKLKAGDVVLAAPRRFGKTSVMYRLIDEPAWDYRVVHADLQHMTEPAQLITELVEQLAKDTRLSKIISGLSYLPKRIWSGFKENIEEVELVKLKLKLKEQVRLRWQESGEELFEKVAASETTIIFILDELPMMIDRMARSEAHREEAKTMLRWLRALRQKPNVMNVRFLIAGSIGIGHVLNDLGEVTAINDFEQMRLEPFPLKTAAKFLDELAESHEITISRPSKKRMLELIGIPVPYFIQIIFSEVDKTHAQDGEQVTPKKVERIYRDKVLAVDCKTYFDHYYGRLRDYYKPREEKASKRILRELALSGSLSRDVCYQFHKEIFGRQAEIEEFNRLMTDLENDFYVRYGFDTRRYEFSCKLLRDWWLRHYGMDTGV